jgi:parallel beta-helix repeat protein
MQRVLALLVATVVVAGGLVVAVPSPSGVDPGPAQTAETSSGPHAAGASAANASTRPEADAVAGAAQSDGPDTGRAAIVDTQRRVVNVLEVRATGEGAYEYTFTVDGFVQRTRVTDRIRAEADDEVRAHSDGTVTVRGSTGNEQSDAYLVRGRVVAFRQTGGQSDGSVVLNGLPVSVADLLDAHVFEVVSRDEDEEVAYQFSVRGTVEGTSADGHSADDSDRITRYENGTAVVRGSTGDQSGDAYRIEGTITDFRKTGGESDYFLRYDGLGFPPSDFGVSDGDDGNDGDDAPEARRVNACTVIDEPGTYRLTRDVGNADAGTCIRISADDVTFDGDGHRIVGVDDEESFGIDVTPEARGESVDSVVVRDVRVSDWGTGVRVGTARERRGATDVTVRGVASFSNTGAGVLLSDTTDSRLVDSTARDNAGNGVHLQELGPENVVRNTTSRGNDVGVFMFESRNSVVRDNRVTDNSRHGISTSNGDRGVEIADNLVADNGGDGVNLDDSQGVTVSDNAVRSNDGSGFDFEDVSGTVARNVLRGNGRYGLVLEYSDDTVVSQNTVRDNGLNGVALLDGSDDNTVRRNTVCGNREPQILVDERSGNNTVVENRLSCG